MGTNKPIVISFDASIPAKIQKPDKIEKPVTEVNNKSERLESDQKKRTETMESLPSEMAPPTPPFPIKNKDLVQTHGKYRDVIPKLDFTQLNKKKSKSK